MKIKTDFVTNSSSASFLLYIQSKGDNLEDFKESFERYMTFHASVINGSARFFNPNDIEQISSNTFLVSDWTSMYNYFNDIPEYMRDLLVMFIVEKEDLKSDYGFLGFKFKIEEDH